MSRTCLSCGRELPIEHRCGPRRKLCRRPACLYKRQYARRLLRAEAEVRLAVPPAVLSDGEAEVRRWSIALADAVALGLTHLVAGRAKRLAEARKRLDD